jgi:two-component sensor histidine kinase/PAS domain-containing protein
MLQSQDLSPRSFAIAGAIMAAALAVRAGLDPVLPALPPFTTLYPAVALAGLLCGPFASAASGIIGLVVAIYAWIPPRLSFSTPNLTDCVSVCMFTAASAIVLWVAGTLRAQLAAATLARYALDLGLAAGGIGTWNMNLRSFRITASSAALALHGLQKGADQTTAQDWLRGVPAEDAAAVTAHLRRAVQEGAMACYRYRVGAGPDGPRWIAARGRVVMAGGERRLLCALVDITEEVRVQDELRRERERLSLALNAGSLAVWDFDPATGAAAIDTRYAAKLGLGPEVGSLTLAQIGERIHPEDLARVAAEHAAMVASGTGYHIEYRIVTGSGEIRWHVSQGITVRDDSQPGWRMVGIIQDITDRRQREEDLADLAAAREVLVREADHRIKNSLQLVSSLLSFQLRGVTDPAAADALRGAIGRVGAIAASHLALQGSEDLRRVDMAVTLEDLCAHFALLHPAIAIVCRAPPPLILDADRAIPLGLAVSEVLTNALRHAFPEGKGGTVVVEAATELGHLILRISDDGVGMPAPAREPGLGSRIISSFASRLEAEIHTESTPGQGTRVTLRLPLQAKTAG